MKIKVFYEFCVELESLWKALEPVSSHYIFQSYEWLRFWQETIGQQTLGMTPWVMVVLDASGQPRMTFPFGVRKQLKIRILEFLGGGQGDYQGPLIHNEWVCNLPAIQSAWLLVQKQLPKHDVQHFMKLPAVWGAQANPMLHVWPSRFQDHAYSLSLPQSFEEFQNKQRKKIRADSNRQRRRLTEMGYLAFEMLDGNAGMWQGALDVMIGQKRDRYRSTGVPDIFSDAAVQRFYRELPQIATEGRVHCAILRLNDEIVATHWGAVYQNRFYYLMPTITNGPLRSYSPGRLLLEDLVEWSIAQRLSLFDFTIGGEEYKRDWCDGEMALFEHLRIATPFGFPYLGYIRLRRRVRKSSRVWNVVKFLYSGLRYGIHSAKKI